MLKVNFPHLEVELQIALFHFTAMNLRNLPLQIGAFALPLLAQAAIPNGLYSTGCADGLLRTQHYIDNFVVTTESFHQDQACQSLSFEFTTSGGVQFPQNLAPAIDPQPIPIDFTYTEVELTLHRTDLVADFNQRKVCGLEDWSLKKPQKITGLKCALFNLTKPTSVPKKGDKKFGIYKLEEEKLYYGLMTPEHPGSTPDRRPQQYDSRPYYLIHFEIR